MSQRFAVVVMGQDRPGIVAEVSGALLGLGANVEDVSTSILRGHFAMMLVVAGPDQLQQREVETALDPLRRDDLAFSTWAVHGSLENTQATHVLTVYGPDTTGIVHAVAKTMAESGVNICDMVCRLHEGTPPIYVLTVEAALPAGLDPAKVESRIAAAVQPLGLDLSLRSVERAEL